MAWPFEEAMKTYNDCDIHPSSTMHNLMEAAERSRKPEDAKKVVSHYAEVHRVFQQQCGLSNSTFKTRWAVGRD